MPLTTPPTEMRTPAPTPILQELENLSKGLLFISETEAPLQVVHFKAGSDLLSILRLDAGVPASEPAREQPLDYILRERSSPPEGAGDIDLDQASRYAAIRKLLQSRLSNASAYRVGKNAPQTMYLIGQLPDGSWAGLKTVTVDT